MLIEQSNNIQSSINKVHLDDLTCSKTANPTSEELISDV